MTDIKALPGEICWLDLSVPDEQAAKSLMDFYRKALGWDFRNAEPDVEDYFIGYVNECPVVGLAIIPNKPSVWVPYFSTVDIAQSLAHVTEYSGTVIWGPEPASQAATLALCLDSTGAVFGYFEPHTFHGFGSMNSPAAPAWFNLTSDHIDKSVDFYRNVLGVNVDPMPGAGYTLNAGRQPFGTIMPDNGDQNDRVGFNHPGDYWSWFLSIASTKVTCDAVRAAGGQVVGEAQPTPFGVLSAILDPVVGVKIYLLEPLNEENENV